MLAPILDSAPGIEEITSKSLFQSHQPYDWELILDLISKVVHVKRRGGKKITIMEIKLCKENEGRVGEGKLTGEMPLK